MKEDKNISHISHFLTFEFFDMSLANENKQANNRFKCHYKSIQ